jgi:bifunctional ADP-heptose synthase (sugar kinase/adenylyltransferase)
VLGDHPLKDFVINGLVESGVKCVPLIDADRPTVNKNVIIADGYRLLKIDTLDNRTISGNILDELTKAIHSTTADAIVFSDFRHGIFNRITIPELTKAMSDGAIRVADSQVASRWGNITEFKKFDLITPNEKEVRFALADQDSTIGRLSSMLRDEAECKMMIITLGERGIFTVPGERRKCHTNHFSIDSFAGNVVDAVGAGDALLAYATLSLLAGDSEVVTSILGSMAAACECEFDGNIPVKPEDVINKINDVERMTTYSGRYMET